jgi:hypothetical protein
LTVSVGLNRALKRRPGLEAHNIVEEFRAKVNVGKSGRRGTPAINRGLVFSGPLVELKDQRTVAPSQVMGIESLHRSSRWRRFMCARMDSVFRIDNQCESFRKVRRGSRNPQIEWSRSSKRDGGAIGVRHPLHGPKVPLLTLRFQPISITNAKILRSNY